MANPFVDKLRQMYNDVWGESASASELVSAAETDSTPSVHDFLYNAIGVDTSQVEHNTGSLLESIAGGLTDVVADNIQPIQDFGHGMMEVYDTVADVVEEVYKVDIPMLGHDDKQKRTSSGFLGLVVPVGLLGLLFLL